MKAIAIASPKRSQMLKDLPTTVEGGLPEFQVSAWNAVFAEKRLPAAIQAQRNGALMTVLDEEATRARLLSMGFEIPVPPQRTAQALEALVHGEVVRWKTVLKGIEVPAN